jgi:LysM repeat protein
LSCIEFSIAVNARQGKWEKKPLLIHGIIPEMKSKSIHQFIIPLMIFLASCIPSGQLTLPDSAFTSTPVIPTIAPSPTPTITSTPTPRLTSTPLPSPTSTPRVHTIKSGETLLGIAWFYNVSLDELKAMNQDVNPNIMIVGTDLLIPVATLPPTNLTPEPTPIQLPLEGLNCLPDAEGGVWCFVWVNNTSSEAYENVTIGFNLADLQATQVFSSQGTAPLNILLAGEKIPVALYFPGPVPQPFQKSAQFVSAVPYNPESGRYLPINIEVTSDNPALEDQLVSIKGIFTLDEPASNVAIVVVALDEQGNLVGLRRWQSTLSEPTKEGAFQIDLAAMSGKIVEYLLFAEAQP